MDDHPLSCLGLANPGQRRGSLSEQRVENGCGRALDDSERFGKQLGVAIVKADIVGAGAAGVQAHGAADDEGNGFGFGLSCCFAGGGARFCYPSPDRRRTSDRDDPTF